MNGTIGRCLRLAVRFGSGAAVAVLALAGCNVAPSTYHPEMYSEWNPSRPAQSTSRVVRCEEITFWEKDPKKKESAGYLETREVTPAGSLDTVTQYLVYDLNQKAPFGLVSNFGTTSIWRGGGAIGNGRWERIGDFELKDAVKVLFKRSALVNVGFEPLPYTPTND
jgi:hypothetical protein